MYKLFEKKIMKDKRGVTLGEVPRVVLLLGIAGVIGVIMLLLMDTIDDNTAITAGSFAANASTDAQAGIGEVFEQFDIVGLVVGLGVVLVIVLGVFAGRTRGL